MNRTAIAVAAWLGTTLLATVSASAAADLCIVGNHVLAGPGNHPATVLAVSAASCRLHYEDHAYPDGWDYKFNLKGMHQDANNAALAAKGPRPGKYTITLGAGMYDGYLMLGADGRYDLFLPGGGKAGGGRYSFDKAAGRVRWDDGPMADSGWNGTQKLEGDGAMLKIRIGKQAVATNSGR